MKHLTEFIKEKLTKEEFVRNHGFILTDIGWVLSPAYDLNPSIEKIDYP